MAPLETVVPTAPAAALSTKVEHVRAIFDRTRQSALPETKGKPSASLSDQTMPPPALTGGKDLTVQPANSAKGKGQQQRPKRKSRGSRKSGDTKDGKKATNLTGNGNKRARTSKPVISNTQRGEAKSPTDPELVKEVRAYMKANKVSQVVAGQEARVSQAVISQWLSMKYHGHNDKVDKVMREWLEARRTGQIIMPDPDAKTSCLRPARSTTLREKLEKGMLPAGSQLWSSSAATPVQERLLDLKPSELYSLPSGATPRGVLKEVTAQPTGGATHKRVGQDIQGSARKKTALASPMPWVSPTGQAAVQILQNMLGEQPGSVSAEPSPGASPLVPQGSTLMAPPSSAKRNTCRDDVPDLLSPGTANATELLRQLSKPVDSVSPPSLLPGDDAASVAATGDSGSIAALPEGVTGLPAVVPVATGWQEGCV